MQTFNIIFPACEIKKEDITQISLVYYQGIFILKSTTLVLNILLINRQSHPNYFDNKNDQYPLQFCQNLVSVPFQNYKKFFLNINLLIHEENKWDGVMIHYFYELK